MNKSIFEVISLGRKYQALWPTRPELLQYFSQYRAVVVSRFIGRYFPSLAFLLIVTQYALGGVEVLSSALVYFIFVLSMPVQGLLILGKQSQKPLPPALASWYRAGVEKLKEQHCQQQFKARYQQSPPAGAEEVLQLTLVRPSFMDLAQLLNITYKQA